MAKRIVVWHFPTGSVEAPAIYLETDYAPVCVRCYSTKVPRDTQTKFSIKADGVEVCADPPTVEIGDSSGLEDGFTTEFFSAGSWLTCVPSQIGAVASLTVQLELVDMDESDEDVPVE